jgi:Rrf2 family protein
MISQTSEYALRTMLYLASHDGRPVTTRQIAEAARIPPSYLCKVLQSLSRAGLIRSQRGLHGGSILCADPKSITVYDVVAAVDHIPRIKTCPLALGDEMCPLHRWLDETLLAMEKILRQSSIADLLGTATEKRLEE